MPCAFLCTALVIPSNTVLLAVVMHFYTTLLPRCFADAAVIRNYRDNHSYSQFFSINKRHIEPKRTERDFDRACDQSEPN